MKFKDDRLGEAEIINPVTGGDGTMEKNYVQRKVERIKKCLSTRDRREYLPEQPPWATLRTPPLEPTLVSIPSILLSCYPSLLHLPKLQTPKDPLLDLYRHGLRSHGVVLALCL